MSGNGPPIGIRRGTRPMHPRPAVFQRTRTARAKTRVTTLASPISRFPAKSSKAARISARRITAADTDQPHVMLNRSIRPQVTSGFDASSEQNEMNHNREENVMSNKRPPQE